MAAAISRIRSLPVGLLRTRKIKATAKSTAASPPATPNKAVVGSIPSLDSRRRTPRRFRLKQPRGSPREVERSEPSGRLRAPRFDVRHASHARPLRERALEVGKRLPAPFGHDLDRPVVVVAHPAGQRQITRSALD